MRHETHIHLSGNADYVAVSKHQCPACQGYLIRTPRRSVDRVLSLFLPVLRYRCQRFSCQWHGNLRMDRGAGTSAARGEGSAGVAARTRHRSNRLPLSFTVHMALSFAGMVLVVLVGTVEPLDIYRTLNFKPSDRGWSTTVSLRDPAPAGDSTLDARPALAQAPDPATQ